MIKENLDSPVISMCNNYVFIVYVEQPIKYDDGQMRVVMCELFNAV